MLPSGSIKNQFLSKSIKLKVKKSGSPHKTQAIQKSFTNSITKK